MAPPFQFSDVELARRRIAPYIRRTPFLSFDFLQLEKKLDVWLKCEQLQRTGSFKIRGAANCILENITQAKKSGVIAASAGNHAQGVAAICHSLGIKSVIVMPVPTPGIKIQHTQRWGAEVKLVGAMYDESYEHAMELSKQHGYLFIHPFRDPKIMAGQGTIALELLEEPSFQAVEAVVISIGGGGLLSGIGTVLKEKKPDLKIYGVTSKNAPSAYEAIKSGKACDKPVKFTLAEGVATKKTDQFMVDHLKPLIDGVFSLSEESIAHAISILSEHGKILVEGAGALPIAAILEGMIPHKKIAAVLSGGNIDLPALSNVLQRGLVEQGRLVRLLITIVDRPGGLNALTQVLADKRANILQVFHQRATLHTAVGEAEVEVDIETRGYEHTKEITAALEEKGFRVNRIS